MSVETIADRKAAALNPDWDNADRVHDWRNYILPTLKTIWLTLSLKTRIALVNEADKRAGAEDWD